MTNRSQEQILRLRRIKFDDLETRVDWLNNPKIYQGITIDIPVDLQKTIEWFERNKKLHNRVDLILEDMGTVIAMTGITESNGISATGYTFVNPNLLGRGYGKVANFLKLVYAFNIMGVKVYKTTINSRNTPSRK